MNAFKGTPGPWEAQEIAPEDPQWGACEIWPANGDRPVATMVCGVDNARLIAAAPDLLEALQDALCALECCGKDYPAATKASAAIAKATGGPA